MTFDASMNEVMDALGEERLVMFDEILRAGHATYSRIEPKIKIEHDPRAQAACIYSHIVAEAERRFEDFRGVRFIDARGLKLWEFEDAGVVVSFKKMDEIGVTRNYQTNQQKDFDCQLPLEGIPLPPIRLRVGYLLDEFQTSYIRTQIAAPNGKKCLWCAAIHPPEEQVPGEVVWFDALEGVDSRLAI